MTKLDSILRSRDITLLTKVCIVKAMVFPVVMNGCESWTIKMAECQTIDAIQLWYWRRLKCPLDCKEIKPVNSKGNQSWIFTEGLMLKLKLRCFGHMIGRADKLEKALMLGEIEGRRERGWQDEMVGWHHWLNGCEFDQAPGDGKVQGCLVCWNPLGCKEMDMIEQVNTADWHLGLTQDTASGFL